jgi:N-acetylmuramoyl-L-alanine amidase
MTRLALRRSSFGAAALALALALCLAGPARGEPLGSGQPVVCLDPGHGGKDVGVRATGVVEKDLTLTICNKVKALLERRGYRVFLTRSGDFALPVEDRTGAANLGQATAFVSVHVDAGFGETATGPRVYSYTGPAAEEPGKGRAAPNAAEWSRVPPVIRAGSVKLARCLATALDQAGSPAAVVQEAPLLVLAGARMPAALVEVGVLPAEAARLAKDETQARLAGAIARGVDIFLHAAGAE